MQVEMKVMGLMVDPVTNMPIVILKDDSENHVLPIWVGIFEANAIALKVEAIDTPRPMTHDLLYSMVGAFGARVDKIVVTELRENTYFAQIHMQMKAARSRSIRGRAMRSRWPFGPRRRSLSRRRCSIRRAPSTTAGTCRTRSGCGAGLRTWTPTSSRNTRCRRVEGEIRLRSLRSSCMMGRPADNDGFAAGSAGCAAHGFEASAGA